MIKGKNILWGTVVYAAALAALYNRRDVTLEADEAAALGGVAERRKGKSSDPAGYRKQALQVAMQKSRAADLSSERQTAFLAKTWVR